MYESCAKELPLESCAGIWAAISPLKKLGAIVLLPLQHHSCYLVLYRICVPRHGFLGEKGSFADVSHIIRKSSSRIKYRAPYADCAFAPPGKLGSFEARESYSSSEWPTRSF